MKCGDIVNTSEINNGTIIKYIEQCNYTSNDFSELLQSDNVPLEYSNASPEIDFIRTEIDPLIPSSTPILPENITDAISTMRDKCNVNHQLSNESNNKDKDFLEEINTFLCESDTSNSMMYCRFQFIKEYDKSEVLNCATNNENIIINEYYDEPYLHEFIGKCVPFLALWTPITNNKVNNGIEIRQSNATIESWFKTVKVDIIDGDRRWKCDRFLRLMRERVLNVHKQIKYNIRKKMYPCA
ncbi:hypothetical protein QTP88_009608 [Uroleucon formosanum]